MVSNKVMVIIFIMVLAIAGLTLYAFSLNSNLQRIKQEDSNDFYSLVLGTAYDLNRSKIAINENASYWPIRLLGTSALRIEDIFNNYMDVSDSFSNFLYSTITDRNIIAGTLGGISFRVHSGQVTSYDKEFIGECISALDFLLNSLPSRIYPPTLFETFEISNETANIQNFHDLAHLALYLPLVTNTTAYPISLNSNLTDDFESYDNGSLPIPPWEFLYNTNGSIVISSDYLHPNKSLLLIGDFDINSYYPTIASWKFYTNESIIGYEVCCMVDSNATVESLCVGFPYFRALYSEEWHASVQFLNLSGRQVIVAKNEMELMPYEVGKWYKIHAELNRDTNRYYVWIDDVLVAQNITDISNPPYQLDLYQLQYFGLGAIWTTGCYFDNATIFIPYHHVMWNP